MVMACPGEITLVAIGPLTNVALAFLLEPRVPAALAGLMIMGGVVGGPGALDLPWTEHNFRSDPEAAHIVLASGAAIKVVPLDVTMQVRIRAEDGRVSEPRARRFIVPSPIRSTAIRGIAGGDGPICTTRWPSRR